MATKTYILENLECANCAEKLERALNKMKNVKATVTFMTQKLVIETDENMDEIEQEATKIITKLEPEVVLKARSR